MAEVREYLAEILFRLAPPRRRALPDLRSPELAAAWRTFLWTRLVVWVAGVGAVALLGVSDRAGLFDPAGVTEPFGPVADALLAPAARWDSVWFLDIAREGYASGERAAFFPLYPLLARVVGVLFGSALVGGLVVSLGCLLAGLALLHRLVALDFGDRVAGTTVVLVACFPMAFFLSAVYSEALFLALSVGAVLAARTGHWAWAGMAGGLAATTRSAGVVLLVPLAVLWWQGRRRPADAAWLALVPGGLAAFCAGLWIGGHDLWAPFAAQEHWFRTFAGPFGAVPDGLGAAWEGARQLLSGSRSPVYFEAAGGDPFEVARLNLVDATFLAGALVALVGALVRLPRAYSLYALAALALPLSYPVAAQPLMSLPRFLVVLWPLHLWLAVVVAERPLARRATVAVFTVGLVVFTALFATWEWVA